MKKLIILFAALIIGLGTNAQTPQSLGSNNTEVTVKGLLAADTAFRPPLVMSNRARIGSIAYSADSNALVVRTSTGWRIVSTGAGSYDATSVSILRDLDSVFTQTSRTTGITKSLNIKFPANTTFNATLLHDWKMVAIPLHDSVNRNWYLLTSFDLGPSAAADPFSLTLWKSSNGGVKNIWFREDGVAYNDTNLPTIWKSSLKLGALVSAGAASDSSIYSKNGTLSGPRTVTMPAGTALMLNGSGTMGSQGYIYMNTNNSFIFVGPTTNQVALGINGGSNVMQITPTGLSLVSIGNPGITTIKTSSLGNGNQFSFPNKNGSYVFASLEDTATSIMTPYKTDSMINAHSGGASLYTTNGTLTGTRQVFIPSTTSLQFIGTGALGSQGPFQVLTNGTGLTMGASPDVVTLSTLTSALSFGSGGAFTINGMKGGGTVALSTEDVSGFKNIKFPNDSGTIALRENVMTGLKRWGYLSVGNSSFTVCGGLLGNGLPSTLTGTASSSFMAFSSSTRLGTMVSSLIATTSASAGAQAGYKMSDLSTGVFRSTSSYAGGFKVILKFGSSITSSTARLFVGLMKSTYTFIDTDEPSNGLFNSPLIGVGKDGSDANLQIITNDGVTAPGTKTDLGVQYQAGALYTLILTSAPNSSVMHIKLIREDLTGKYIDADMNISSDLPGANDLMNPMYYTNTGSGTSAVNIHMISQYAETDN